MVTGLVSMSTVVTVRPETSAVEALLLMDEEGLSAVGVTDNTGTIIG